MNPWFGKATKKEAAATGELEKEIEKVSRQRAAEELMMQRSLRRLQRLAKSIGEIPIEDGLSSVGFDLTGEKK